ncbi:hypothetical protein [Bradyrhizobium sp. SRS-191]|uniref:hypothetical protein n=1 Tax=Bradyrhizobium sp. SRS-191 TaxID=2962606 RepID=UPI00211EE34F|nr:hypothetical protein [Bradyrhizobium sp. SRS-191]
MTDIECSRARLTKTAGELGLRITLAVTDDVCEAIEGQLYGRLIAGIRARAELSHWGPQLAEILLRHVMTDADKVGEVIDRVDNDDGWPECPVLNAIKGLCCAREFRGSESRWLAEACLQVGELQIPVGQGDIRRPARIWAGQQLAASIIEITPAAVRKPAGGIN